MPREKKKGSTRNMAHGEKAGSVAAHTPPTAVKGPPPSISGPPQPAIVTPKPKRKKVTPAARKSKKKATVKPHKITKTVVTVEDAMDSLVGQDRPWWVDKNELANWVVFNILVYSNMVTLSEFYQTRAEQSISMEKTARKGVKVGDVSCSPFDLFVGWAMALDINVKRQKEVVKLALMFPSFQELKSCYTAAVIEEESFQASLEPDSTVTVLMLVLESPPCVKRKLRKSAQELQAKILQVPKEVSDLDKSLGSITVVMKKRALVLREQYEAKKKELDAIRLKVDAENKLQEPIKDMMATYYAKKAGALSRQEREKVVSHWQLDRNGVKSQYRLDQYITLISRRTGAAAAARYVPTVKGLKPYKDGLELRVFDPSGEEGKDSVDDEKMDDEDEDSNQQARDLDIALELL